MTARLPRLPPRRLGADIAWIDYRHSRAHVWSRIDRGEARASILVCPDCGTEVDVVGPVHSPRCHRKGADA